jgi:hypothetical protein
MNAETFIFTKKQRRTLEKMQDNCYNNAEITLMLWRKRIMNILSMQEKLKALSYDVDLSNAFDTKTDWAMRFFCKKNGELKRLLSADAIPGVVGNETVFIP